VSDSIADEDREALRRLVEVGRMIRRVDGSYGTASKKMITNAVAVRLKARHLAVAGFKKDMVASERGKRLNAEARDA
jgi:hypothetical protein